MVGKVREPLTDSRNSISPFPASMSVNRMAFPFAVEKVSVVSSTRVCAAGSTFTGASFTPLTAMVTVATLL